MQVECAVVTVFGPAVYGGICDMAGFFYGCFIGFAVTRCGFTRLRVLTQVSAEGNQVGAGIFGLGDLFGGLLPVVADKLPAC